MKSYAITTIRLILFVVTMIGVKIINVACMPKNCPVLQSWSNKRWWTASDGVQVRQYGTLSGSFLCSRSLASLFSLTLLASAACFTYVSPTDTQRKISIRSPQDLQAGLRVRSDFERIWSPNDAAVPGSRRQGSLSGVTLYATQKPKRIEILPYLV